MNKLWNALGEWVMDYKRPKWMRDHFSIGRFTMFGANAMHFMMEWRTKRYGVICFRLFSFDKRFPVSVYFSPNCTPWACTFCRGIGLQEQLRAVGRRLNFGHNFDSWDPIISKQLRKFNNDFDSCMLTKYKTKVRFKMTGQY